MNRPTPCLLRSPSPRRFVALSLACCSLGFAGEIPNSGGKLDYGTDGLPIPPAIVRNGTSPRTAQLLGNLLASEKIIFHRARLVSELGQTRLPAAVAPVVHTLSDPSPVVRASACAGLVALCEPGTVAEDSRAAARADAAVPKRLADLLNDPDAAVRTSALRAIVAVEGKAGNAVTAALSLEKDPALFACAIALAQTPEQGNLLANRMATISPDLQPDAIRAIGRCKAVGQVQVLIRISDSKSEISDLPTMIACCDALHDLGSSDAVRVLQKLCGHTHPTVRRAAMRALGSSATANVVRGQGSIMLKDADPTVRQAAVEAMTPVMAPEVARPIATQLGDEYAPLYAAARAALINAKDDATRQECIALAGELLDHSDARRREDGSYILGHYRSDHRIDRHIQLLDHTGSGNDWKLTAQAVESLGLIGRKEAVPGIRELALAATGTPDAEHYGPAISNALIAAGRLGITDALPACSRVLGADPKMSDPRQRAAAAFAIGILGTRGDGSGQLSGLLTSPMESMDTRVEAIKGIGNLRAPDARARLGANPQGSSPAMQWMKEWTIARCENTPEKHEPVETSFAARVSVTDLEGK